jgi:hypothetical protein
MYVLLNENVKLNLYNTAESQNAKQNRTHELLN